MKNKIMPFLMVLLVVVAFNASEQNLIDIGVCVLGFSLVGLYYYGLYRLIKFGLKTAGKVLTALGS